MNRKYSRAQYLEIVQQIRADMPGAAITTDIIVGFPGETGADFQTTLDVLQAARFDGVFSFVYSPRAQTEAASYPDQISSGEKSARIQELVRLQKTILAQKNRQLVGATVEVLVDGVSKKSSVSLCGKTRTNKTVNFRGESGLIGNFAHVAITEGRAHSLSGRLLGSEKSSGAR
ncbi:MAG: TRAM domain-containing protein, partial [Terriglobia bacterium]